MQSFNDRVLDEIKRCEKVFSWIKWKDEDEFSEDFCFELSEDEYKNLMFQNGISNKLSACRYS